MPAPTLVLSSSWVISVLLALVDLLETHIRLYVD